MTTTPRCALPVLALAAALGALGCGELEGDAGSQPPPGGPPPPGFATEMIDAHTAVRAGATPTPSPALAPLAWAPTVAATAQAWADGCVYQHNPALHSLVLGENIAATAPAGARSAAYIVGLWASEAPFYDYTTNTCDTSNPGNEAGTCGHYTQLVWRSTIVVGCGMRTCTTGSPFGAGSWDFWVCDYAPPGNIVGQRPY